MISSQLVEEISANCNVQINREEVGWHRAQPICKRSLASARYQTQRICSWWPFQGLHSMMCNNRSDINSTSSTMLFSALSLHSQWLFAEWLFASRFIGFVQHFVRRRNHCPGGPTEVLFCWRKGKSSRNWRSAFGHISQHTWPNFPKHTLKYFFCFASFVFLTIIRFGRSGTQIVAKAVSTWIEV